MIHLSLTQRVGKLGRFENGSFVIKSFADGNGKIKKDLAGYKKCEISQKV